MFLNLKKVFFVASIVFLAYQVEAQKRLLTIEEATNGLTTTLATKGVINPSWQPGTECFWQVIKDGDREFWQVINYCQAEHEASYFVQQGKYPLTETVTAIPAIKWLNNKQAYFINGKNIILGTLSNRTWNWETLVALPEKAENITVDKSMQVAFTLKNNLWLWHPGIGQIRVTNFENESIVNGQAVHRNEFGIDKGIFFSPKGSLMAYYCMDQTMVKYYPVVKWDAMPARADEVTYPMAGDVSHEVTLVVFDPHTGKKVTMHTGETERDHYLTSVTWSPDEKYIYIAILNREQNHLCLNKYNVSNGNKVITLFEEWSKAYVHPTHPLTFVPGKNEQFIWWSERDGFEHLYLYSTNGIKIKQLTKGKWVVNELLGFNTDAKKVLFTSSLGDPREKHIYSVGLDDLVMNRIDKDRGMHTGLCSEDGKYVLDVYSASDIPKNSIIRATNCDFRDELVISKNPLELYERPETRNVEITAADGKTTLYGKLILPLHFNGSNKYPVIVYLYNGPNVQLVHNSFPASGNLWYDYMAERGYVVFVMDGRGSWNRGIDFEQVTHLNLGKIEMEDQLKGVEYLKSLPFVDATKMGVHGWSFGGFMTTSLMLKYPNIFKCAVAGGPVMDWKMYEVMYTERYMSTPKKNPSGYATANLLDKVSNLKGKLLLIHGTNDDVVVWQNSINFLRKCVDEGVQVDYFVYPGHEHNVRGKDRVHLMEKITEYFDEYLKK